MYAAYRQRFSCTIVVLLFLFLGVSEVAGLPPLVAGPILGTIGRWLGLEILSYGAGKAFDRVLGLGYEKQLRQIEAKLVADLQKSSGDTQKLQVELATARSQLKILSTLLTSRPTSNELEHFKRQLTKDLDNLRTVQKQHDQKFLEHSQRMNMIEKNMEGLSTRVEKIEGRDGMRHSEAEPPAPGIYQEDSIPDESYDVERPRRRPSYRQPARDGVTLTISVTGNSNGLNVEEVEASRSADVGAFEIASGGGQQRFRLLAGTGGVITIHGHRNTIDIPRYLCGRVRVVDRGRGNTLRGCG